jgi:hypothetical protein
VYIAHLLLRNTREQKNRHQCPNKDFNLAFSGHQNSSFKLSGPLDMMVLSRWEKKVSVCIEVCMISQSSTLSLLQFAMIVMHDNVLYCSNWCMILSRSWEAVKWNCLQRNTSLVLFSCTLILSTCISSFSHLTATPANNCSVQVIVFFKQKYFAFTL